MTIFSALASCTLLAGCVGPPFNYAEDRCLGSYNQCQASCTATDNGPSRTACVDRCSTRETQCYNTGDDGAGTSLATDAAIADAKNEREKQAGFERWKKQRQSEQESKEEEVRD